MESAHVVSRRAEIAEMLRGVARRHIRAPGRVFIFGSQANRATMKRADIDIGVDVGRKLDSAEYFALLDDFAALPMLYPVDLVDFATVSADFRRFAESDIELLHRIPDMRVKRRKMLADLPRALDTLAQALDVSDSGDIVRDAAIKRFEYCFELCWNALKLFIAEEGAPETAETRVYGSVKSVLRRAFAVGILEEKKPWMDMREDRNLTAHTYNENTALGLFSRLPAHYAAMRALQIRLAAMKPADDVK